MTGRYLMVGAGILLAASQVGPAAAQQKTVEEQKKEADLDLVRAQIDTANQKLLTDALTAAKQPREGSAGFTSAENTAEGLILSDYILKRTALQLATDVQTWRAGQPGMSEDLLVVFGASAPSVAQWIAYEKMVAQLASALTTATSDWEKLTRKPAPPATANRKFFVDPVLAASIAAVVGTATSLLKTDFAIGGTKLAPTKTSLEGSSSAPCRNELSASTTLCSKLPPRRAMWRKSSTL